MADDIKNVYQLSFSGEKVNDILVKADGIKILGASAAPSLSELDNVGLVKVDGITIVADEYGTLSEGRTNAEFVLSSGGWTNKNQTVSNSKVTDNADLIIAPAPTNLTAYAMYGVYCYSQSGSALTFSYTASIAPSSDINVNALIWYHKPVQQQEV